MRPPLPLNRSLMALFGHLLEVVFWVSVFACACLLAAGIYFGSFVIGLIGGCGLLIALYAGFIEPHWFQIVHHVLRLRDGRARNIRIVFLSDFHAGQAKTRSVYDQLFKRVAALHPDLILLGGDYVEARSDAARDLVGIAMLKPRLGTYFILGNHDYEDHPALIRSFLSSFGAKDLTGQTISFGVGEDVFQLVGIDDAWLGAPRGQLGFVVSKKPTIVLTHESDILLDLPEEAADLVFLGHTHGGQVRLPGYGAVARMPQTTPHWLDRGLKTWRGMQLLISQGIGESSARVRLLARPQIVVVDL